MDELFAEFQNDIEQDVEAADKFEDEEVRMCVCDVLCVDVYMCVC
jgi:hypothetical protein